MAAADKCPLDATTNGKSSAVVTGTYRAKDTLKDK
jgi:hypothetical protein